MPFSHLSTMPQPIHLIYLPAFLCMIWFFCIAPDLMADNSEDLHEELNDARIAVAIKNKLMWSGGKSFSSIEVTVKDGVAILTGTAESLWAQERARELSQVIRGVRGVIDRIAVGPLGSISDSTLKRHLAQIFAQDPIAEFKNIDLDVDQGIVTLKGRMQSWQEKHIALNVAKMVKGVRKVRDALTINFVTGRPDTNVREEITRRLEFDVWIDSPSLLNIHVREGKAILAGQVKSAYEKSRVSELAWVQGIREVNVDGVEVIKRAQDPMIRSTRPRPTDQQIADALHMILSYDPRVSPFNIGIAVENGSVTLQGDVPFLSIKREAEQDVKNTLGVVSVNNQLNIQGASTLLDQDIRTRVLKAFSHDPVLGKFSLGVAVRKGTALLTGIVDSYYERNHVENVTSRVSGVRALQNDITFSTRKQEKTDWEIQLDIENQVWWNPYLADQDIVAMVEDGKATLTGSVAYSPQRVIAEQQAFEAGASVVVNNLRVGKMSPS